jgi:hypothetical protein
MGRIVDDVLANCEGLFGLAYKFFPYDDPERGFAWTYEDAKNEGTWCSGMIDVSLKERGLGGCGDTIAISNALVCWQPYNPNGYYPRGAVIVNDNAFGSSEGDFSHVGLVRNADNQDFIHDSHYAETMKLGSSGVWWGGDDSPIPHWDTNRWLTDWDARAGYEWIGYLPQLGGDLDPHVYPGHYQHPSLWAAWMAAIAEEEFKIPGVLPVMTSMVELTNAWSGAISGTQPGPTPANEITGYAEAVDFDSLGFFQQRPASGWGAPEQIMDPDYALRAFCQAAVDNQPDPVPTDAAGLGAWCQAVQVSAFPDRYRDMFVDAKAAISQGKALYDVNYDFGTSSGVGDTAALKAGLEDYQRNGWIDVNEDGSFKYEPESSGIENPWLSIGDDSVLRRERRSG